MPVVAMKVASKVKHPNADALWVYRFEADDNVAQVIANTENTYEVGDVAAVALVGTRLKDGTEIRRASIRGVPSRGMAMGKVDKPEGEDLSASYEDLSARFTAWPKISSLSSMLRTVNKVREVVESEGTSVALPPITFRSKVKLHGTNAGIIVAPGGAVKAQSRRQIVTDDGYGLARWVDSVASIFTPKGKPYVLFGEWCGPGVQKGVALNQIDRKIFAAFGVFYDGEWIVDPARIADFAPKHEDIFVLPWHECQVTLDLSDKQTLKDAVEQINKDVALVEEVDPFVRDIFGIEGTGEGLVFYPKNVSDLPDTIGFEDFWFKAKGSEHKVIKSKKAAQVDPEVAKSIKDFVTLFVTDNRCEQIIGELEGEVSVKQTGKFIKALTGDVQKESDAELEASGLKWNKVAKSVSAAARTWFMARLNQF